MRSLVLMSLLLPLVASGSTLVIYKEGAPSPQPVTLVTRGLASDCDGKAWCLVGSDLTAVRASGKPVTAWVHDNGVIRLRTLAEVDAGGHPIDADSLVRALIEEVCSWPAAPGTVAACITRVRDEATGAP